jgi:hypothetical protein
MSDLLREESVMVGNCADKEVLLAYLVEKSGGAIAAMRAFVEKRICDLAADGTWTTLKDAAEQEQWGPWLMEMRLSELGRILSKDCRGEKHIRKRHKAGGVEREKFKEPILAVLNEGGWFQSRIIAERTGTEVRKVCSILKELVGEGRVLLQGSKAQTRYSICSDGSNE